MAAYLKLVEGSIFNGNPITFAVTPLKIEGSTPSFHRMVFEVKCGMSGGNYETIRLTEPVLSEDGIRDGRLRVTGVQTCALPIYLEWSNGKRDRVAVEYRTFN